MRGLRALAPLVLVSIAGCRGMQHALDPASGEAQQIGTLSWLLYGGATLIFLAVMALAAYALFGPRSRARLAHRNLVIGGGIVFPAVTLTALMVYVFSGAPDLLLRGEPELRIEVTGEQFWWRVRYLDAEGRPQFETANEIVIPVDTTVAFRLRTADVIHSFWVPQLAGKLDMIPGRRNILRIQADAPGVYAGQCAEYCGGPHALMGFVVVAHAPGDFERWRAERLAPPAPPADAFAARGAQVFDAAGCGACHRVRGTAANGLAGPDLSYVGSRRSLGAGILPNNQGTLAGWVADSQAIKPGNRMPPYKVLTGEDLRALAAWLGSRR